MGAKVDQIFNVHTSRLCVSELEVTRYTAYIALVQDPQINFIIITVRTFFFGI